MEWNFLIWAGFILRIVYHLTNENYPFSFKTPEGKANIGKKLFSFLVICLVYYISFYYHSDDKYQDGYQLIMVWGFYTTLGWAVDSIFLAVVNFVQQKILSRFQPKQQ